MKSINIIAGLTVETINDQRVVKFEGHVCPLIKRTENLCEQNTSYYGEVLSSRETYATPIGVVRRSYSASGGGLERRNTDWDLVPVAEIEEAQKRFTAASIELAAAKKALEAVTMTPTLVS